VRVPVESSVEAHVHEGNKSSVFHHFNSIVTLHGQKFLVVVQFVKEVGSFSFHLR